MPTIVLIAICSFSLALIFYSLGVWLERFAKELNYLHLIYFWLGFIADSIGTHYVMNETSGFSWNFHTISGILGLGLMFIHSLWATCVLVKKQKEAVKRFHHFSLTVWIIWLVPYGTGLILGMQKA